MRPSSPLHTPLPPHDFVLPSFVFLWTLDLCSRTLTPHRRPQCPNHQRPRKAVGHPDATALRLSRTKPGIETRTLAADLDGSFGRDDDPARRLARQSRAPTIQPPLRTRVHARTARRRPSCAPACAGSHRLTRSIAVVIIVAITIAATARRQQRDAQAQAQKGEGATTIIIVSRSPHDCQRYPRRSGCERPFAHPRA